MTIAQMNNQFLFYLLNSQQQQVQRNSLLMRFGPQIFPINHFPSPISPINQIQQTHQNNQISPIFDSISPKQAMNPLEDNKSVIKKKQHDFTQIDKLIINEETPVGKENGERPLKRKTTKDARSKTNSPISSCKHCGKEFSRQWLLQNHIRTHTGERPFKCDICNKAFADKSNLRAHRQTHSGLKPFKCDRCGKRFALKSYLAKHEESSCSRTNNQLSPQTLYNPIPFPHDIFYNLH